MQNHSATNGHNVIEYIKRQTCENTPEDNAQNGLQTTQVLAALRTDDYMLFM